MAFIRNLVIMTFDKTDTQKSRDNLIGTYESQGYQKISSVKLSGVSDIEELILQGNVKYGSFDQPNIKIDKKNILQFNPSGGLK